MTKALLAFLISFSAVASECYVREVELVTNEVKLAKEICISNIKLDLQVVGRSKATINYTLDGVDASKVIELSYPIERRDGRVFFLAWNLQTDFVGGWCSDATQAELNSTLTMNKDGSDVRIEELQGVISTTNDNCHSGFQEIQSFPYVLK